MVIIDTIINKGIINFEIKLEQHVHLKCEKIIQQEYELNDTIIEITPKFN